jgi:hypothetical protein
MKVQTNYGDDIKDALENLLEALNARGAKTMGYDRWSKLCEEGTAKRVLVDPREDAFTRRLVEQMDPYLVIAAVRGADQLQPILSQFGSDEEAADWLVANRDKLIDLLDDEDVGQDIYETRRNKRMGSRR